MRGIPLILLTIVLVFLPGALSFLKLNVNPPFVFVNEDHETGSPLPGLSICADVSPPFATVSLRVNSGDPYAQFGVHRINRTCWTLELAKPLDADAAGNDGTRGQSFHIAFRCTDGRQQAYGNLDIQVMDINDNKPQFIDTPNAVTVPEDTEPGTVLQRIRTFDPDTGVGGINHFSLQNSFDSTFRLKNGSCDASKCFADLYLVKNLNYDVRSTYTLNIRAVDGANRIRRTNEAILSLTVNVADVQNKPPRFLNHDRRVVVPEDAEVGTKLIQVQAVDGDSGVENPNNIMYTIVNEEAHKFFKIDPVEGWLVLGSTLNREGPAVLANNGAFTVVVEAAEATSPPRAKSLMEFTIVVEDVDDEPPKCNATSYRGTILENAQALIPVAWKEGGGIYVFDHDQGAHGEFELELEGDDGIFEVYPSLVRNQATPIIRVKDQTKLDFEKDRKLEFTLWLKETSERKQTSACKVLIEVIDANDHVPQFSQLKFELRVLENDHPETLVDTITADDVDTAQYLPIVYELEGERSDRFFVNGSGSIFARIPLDREEKERYHLTLSATDNAGRGNTNRTKVDIVVLDTNDQPPVFEYPGQYELHLDENSPTFKGHPTGFAVKATDADKADTPNSKLKYTLDQTDEDSQYFLLEPESGRLEVRGGGIDMESIPRENLTFHVIATDHGIPQPLFGRASVNVFLNDINDNVPVFPQPLYSATVPENATEGHVIITLTATDSDISKMNSAIAYRIMTIQDKFTIHPQSGAISVAKGARLDRDLAGPIFDLEVQAVDHGFPQRSSLTKLKITVDDVNNKLPRFGEDMYKVAVPEDAKIGFVVTKLRATDPDLSAELAYEITDYHKAIRPDGNEVNLADYNYKNLFTVDSKTGDVIVASPLDHEKLGRVSFSVKVTDISGVDQTAKTTIDLTITDINDNDPQFSEAYYFVSIDENTEPGTHLITVTAKDADGNGTVYYGIEGDAGVNKFVAVDSRRGERSETGFFSSYYFVSIDENTEPGTHLITVAAKDADGNGTVYYGIEGDAGVNKFVALDSRRGHISLKSPLDFEVTQWLNFSVVAKDTGVPPLTAICPVFIQIKDVNDNSPTFSKSEYTAQVPENAPGGTLVIKLNATDKDSGSYGTVRYFIAQSDVTKGPFDIEPVTGELKTTAELDREAQDVYKIKIDAIDDYDDKPGPNSRTVSVLLTIRVTDENDNTPTYMDGTPEDLALSQKALAKQQVAVVQASDKDDVNTGNGVVRLGFVGGNVTGFFSIDPSTGIITTSRDLAPLQGPYYLIVQAKDLGLPQPRAVNHTIRVLISDYNDNSPRLTQPGPGDVFHVKENIAGTQSVTSAKAVDPDAGKNSRVTYRIKKVKSNDDWQKFAIHPSTGAITSNFTFDHERQSRYALVVEACDGGTPQLCGEVEFFVHVTDSNDNCPRFKRGQDYIHEIWVSEGTSVNSVIGQFKGAADDDSTPENSMICYSIESGNVNETFALAARNSTFLVLSRELDRESISGYDLVVSTFDCRGNQFCVSQGTAPPLTTTPSPTPLYSALNTSLLLVNISINDINDNPPRFTREVYSGGVQNDAKVGTRTAKVTAIDPDALDVGKLRYSIPAGSIRTRTPITSKKQLQAAFTIDPQNGDISTGIPLLKEWKGIISLKVNVKDSSGALDEAEVQIRMLGTEEQIELVFEKTAADVWKEAPQITSLLSKLTSANASIDDVKDNSAAYATQSRAIVHFAQNDTNVLKSADALRLLDMPSTPLQKKSKETLVSTFKLKFASETTSDDVSGADVTLYVSLAAVIGGLILVLSILVTLYCYQNALYKRKLKDTAAPAIFGSNDPNAPRITGVPGTNLHSSSNPVWSDGYVRAHSGTPRHDAEGTGTPGLRYSKTPPMTNGSTRSVDLAQYHANVNRGLAALPDREAGRLPPRRADDPRRADEPRRASGTSILLDRTVSPVPNYPVDIRDNLKSTEL